MGKVKPINGGLPCGPNGVPCGQLNLCPKDPGVTAKVMAANCGGCKGSLADLDCLVFKLVYNSVSMMFNGDWQDVIPDVQVCMANIQKHNLICVQ